ncbi:MAG: 5-dehydro-4-deoxy-D-glucuronate isomerase [Planctomycetes bacterium GWF2_42_9]|nr:MAG: 5-dehydro-4-deoxy-D-glucuronate isomerase [Planctomycetes bacterium GWF2_42_9]HAL44520.1 5-dehydro-4-deoxy-D-glucuronate isomerase [Phycisphaerales bacterium]
METRYSADAVRFERMNTEEVRSTFLIRTLFVPNKIEMIYWFDDRAIIGSAVPVDGALKLEAGEQIASDYFAQRREAGVINIGGNGIITVDGQRFTMAYKDMLYIPRGSKDIQFESDSSSKPAKFYIVSYPAHKEYPIAKAEKKDTLKANLGTDAECNKRTINKYIHPDGIKSCQLVMGCTELAQNSIWNTMPGHTHNRRTEVYMYFEVDSNSAVFHFMGKPDQTRHIVVRNEQVVLSPSWSIHSGAGLKNYSFVWAMGGENQAFGDMQGFTLDDLK